MDRRVKPGDDLWSVRAGKSPPFPRRDCARLMSAEAPSESPRGRGTPGVQRTHGLKPLAKSEQNGDLGRGRRPDNVETASPPFLQRPARDVWGLLRTSPGGL